MFKQKYNHQTILDCYFKCGSLKETASQIGCSYETVRRVIIGAGVATDLKRGRKRRVSIDDIAKACETMTVEEMANFFGYSEMHLIRIFHENGIAPYNYGLHYRDSERAKKVSEMTNGKFSFVRLIRKNHYVIKCNECGHEFEITNDSIRAQTTQCPKCREEKRKVAQETKRQKADAYNEYIKQCEIKKLINALNKEIVAKTPRKCEVCGDIFYSPYKATKYCSSRCKRKVKCKGYRARARHYGVEYKSGISLVAVYERDNGICQLCGKPVDWNDNTWGKSFGAMYPTIDHIVAMANGGGHTWDNVQLAHAICNSYKRDLIDYGNESESA